MRHNQTGSEILYLRLAQIQIGTTNSGSTAPNDNGYLLTTTNTFLAGRNLKTLINLNYSCIDTVTFYVQLVVKYLT